jgi:hypothetical protein
MRRSRGTLLLAAAATLGCGSAGKEGGEPRQDMIQDGTASAGTIQRVPPIDGAAPAEVEVATFGLG